MPAATRSAAGPLVAMDGLAHRVDLVLRRLAEDLGEQVGLGGEVAVDGPDRHAGTVGHGGDLRRDVSALGDQLDERR